MEMALPDSREEAYIYLANLKKTSPFLLATIQPAFKVVAEVIDEIYSGKRKEGSGSLEAAIFGKSHN